MEVNVSPDASSLCRPLAKFRVTAVVESS